MPNTNQTADAPPIAPHRHTGQRATDHALIRMAETAKAAGMPPDQLKRFVESGYIPQPKQMLFHAAARLCDREDGPLHIAFGGARGPGKSHAVFAQLALDDCQRFAGITTLYLRKVGKAAKESIDRLTTRVLPHTEYHYRRNEGVIIFPNDSVIITGNLRVPSDIDKFLGQEYGAIAIEENTQIPADRIDMLMGSMRTTHPDLRARSYRSTNPGGIGHAAFKKQFIDPYKKGTETETRFIQANYEDNAYLKPEYIRYLKTLGGTLGMMWRDGIWDVGAGAFFTRWEDHRHVISPFPIPHDWNVWAGFDYGHTHPQAIIYMTKPPSADRIYVIGELHQARLTIEEWAIHIKAKEQELNREGRIHYLAGGDVFNKTDDGRTIAEKYMKQGIILQRANTGRVEGAMELTQRLGTPEGNPPATIGVFPNCADLIETIPALQVDPHRPEDVLKVDADPNGNYGDDTYDALRYGIMRYKSASNTFTTRY